MTYVKRGAQLLLVEDEQVQKHIDNGFEVFELPKQKKKRASQEAAEEAAEESAGEADGKDGE